MHTFIIVCNFCISLFKTMQPQCLYTYFFYCSKYVAITNFKDYLYITTLFYILFYIIIYYYVNKH